MFLLRMPYELAAAFVVLIYVDVALMEHTIVIMFLTGYGTLFSIHTFDSITFVYYVLLGAAWASFLTGSITSIACNKAFLFSLVASSIMAIIAIQSTYGPQLLD